MGGLGIQQESYRFYSAMYAGDSAGQVFIPFAWHHESGFFNHLLELLLSRELLDALHKVLIAVPVSSNQLPDQGYCAETPSLIDCVKDATIDVAKLKACEYTARFQDSECFMYGCRFVRKVADPKCYGV
jgi:hypothetical protein